MKIAIKCFMLVKLMYIYANLKTIYYEENFTDVSSVNSGHIR